MLFVVIFEIVIAPALPGVGAVISEIVNALLTTVKVPFVAVSVQEIPVDRFDADSSSVVAKTPADPPLVVPWRVRPAHVPTVLVIVTVLVSLVQVVPDAFCTSTRTLKFAPMAELTGGVVKAS